MMSLKPRRVARALPITKPEKKLKQKGSLLSRLRQQARETLGLLCYHI